MQKRLSWTGGVVGALLVVFVAVAATGARTLRPGETASAPAYANVADAAPPNCDEICGEQAACEEVCRFGSDITCGEYAQYAEDPTCVSCESCTEYSPCELQCLDGGSLATCDEVEPECGGPPADTCHTVCDDEHVHCDTQCYNGSSFNPSTCVAEGYDCGATCYEWTAEYSGVFEDNARTEGGERVVDCYANVAQYRDDPCQHQPILDLYCSSTFLSTEPQGSCSDTYWMYGENWAGC